MVVFTYLRHLAVLLAFSLVAFLPGAALAACVTTTGPNAVTCSGTTNTSDITNFIPPNATPNARSQSFAGGNVTVSISGTVGTAGLAMTTTGGIDVTNSGTVSLSATAINGGGNAALNLIGGGGVGVNYAGSGGIDGGTFGFGLTLRDLTGGAVAVGTAATPVTGSFNGQVGINMLASAMGVYLQGGSVNSSSAGNAGILASSGSVTMVLTGNTAITATAPANTFGIAANALGTLSITSNANLGTSSGVLRRGMSLSTNGSGTTTITQTGGTIYGSEYGIFLSAAGANSPSIATNAGAAIVATGGTGIQATASGTGGLSITSGGTIAGAAGIVGVISNGANTGALNIAVDNSITTTGTGVTASHIGLGTIAVTNTATISGGAIGVGVAGNATKTITNTSTGVITGTTGVQSIDNGVTTVANSGVIVGTGGGNAVRFVGGTGNTLQMLGPNAVLTGNAVGNVSDIVEFGGAGSNSFIVGQIGAGFTQINKTGSSTWTLLGAGTFAGATNVTGGTLRVNGTLNSVVTVNGGAIGGTGSIAGLTANSGIVAPGNSIGTLNVAGNITFAGATYQVEVNAAGQSDKTVATGTATINGGNVQVLAASGAYNQTTQYTILTSGGARTGQFAGVTSNLAFLAPALSYDANNVFLTLTRNSTAVASLGQTPNQVATGTGLDGAALNAPYLNTILGLSAADVPPALDQLSGEAHASIKGVLVNDSSLVRDAILDRIDQAFAALDEAGAASQYVATETSVSDTDDDGAGRILWGHLYGSAGVINADGNAAQTTSSTGGVLLGMDGDVGPWHLGLVAGAGLTTIGARNTSARSTDLSLGVYGGTVLRDGIVIKGGAAVTGHAIGTTRTVALPGIADVLTASYGAATLQAFGEIGKEFDLGAVSLTPFANLALVSHSTGAFTETGGAGALSSAATTTNAAFVTLGFRADHQFVLGNGMLVTASGSLGWRHAFADLPLAANSFAAGGPFNVAGAGIGGDAAVLEAGLDFDISADLGVNLGYAGTIGNAGASHAVKLTVAGHF